MGQWLNENTVITKAGINLLDSMTGSNVIEITRAVAGASYTNPTELVNLTNIADVKAAMSFTAFSKNDDGSSYVDVTMSNAGLTEEFLLQQIGIFTKNASGEDILFLVSQASTPDLIPLPADSAVTITHRLFFKYADSADINYKVNFAGLVTVNMLNIALSTKENVFSKGSAFNRNFTTNVTDIKSVGDTSALGSSTDIARADHIHGAPNNLKVTSNTWTGATDEDEFIGVSKINKSELSQPAIENRLYITDVGTIHLGKSDGSYVELGPKIGSKTINHTFTAAAQSLNVKHDLNVLYPIVKILYNNYEVSANIKYVDANNLTITTDVQQNTAVVIKIIGL